MEKYLNAEFECKCGKTHKLTIKDIIIESGALKKVPDLLKKYTDKDKIYVVCDHNTLKAAGEKLKEILNGAG
ncbi:MAG: sn-glycerol-1-phosphate dehydrogenase, partial [Halanaerobiales bacterium]